MREDSSVIWIALLGVVGYFVWRNYSSTPASIAPASVAPNPNTDPIAYQAWKMSQVQSGLKVNAPGSQGIYTGPPMGTAVDVWNPDSLSPEKIQQYRML